MKRNGFTLIEVLAALAILAVALFILLDAHYSALALHDTIDTEVTFRHLLESTVSRAELEIHAGNLTGTGDFGTRHPDYTWSFEAILAGSDDTILLYETTATIQGPEEERQLKFYVYDIGLGSLIEGSGAGNNMFNEGSMSRRATFNQQGGASQRDTSQRSTSTTRGRSGGSVYE